MNKCNLKNKTFSDSKHILCEVAVLSAYRINFDLWVKENQKEYERYYYINKIEDTFGKVFHRIEESYQCHEMPDFLEVKKHCLYRLRNLK